LAGTAYPKSWAVTIHKRASAPRAPWIDPAAALRNAAKNNFPICKPGQGRVAMTRRALAGAFFLLGLATASPSLAQDKPVQLRFSHWVPTAHPMHPAAGA
jgi:hypothetical protein